MNAPIHKTWSPQEVAVAAATWQRMADDYYGDDVPANVKRSVLNVIAAQIERPFESVYLRFQHHGPSFKAGGSHRNISASVLAERDARKAAQCFQGLTAAVFGDPPPGFSELDKRNTQGRRA